LTCVAHNPVNHPRTVVFGLAPARLASTGWLTRMNSLDYYKIEELLTDEERAAGDRARQFVQTGVLSEIVPCHRAAKFPDHLIPRMGALRFYAPCLQEPLAKLG